MIIIIKSLPWLRSVPDLPRKHSRSKCVSCRSWLLEPLWKTLADTIMSVRSVRWISENEGTLGIYNHISKRKCLHDPFKMNYTLKGKTLGAQGWAKWRNWSKGCSKDGWQRVVINWFFFWLFVCLFCWFLRLDFMWPWTLDSCASASQMLTLQVCNYYPQRQIDCKGIHLNSCM